MMHTLRILAFYGILSDDIAHLRNYSTGHIGRLDGSVVERMDKALWRFQIHRKDIQRMTRAERELDDVREEMEQYDLMRHHDVDDEIDQWQRAMDTEYLQDYIRNTWAVLVFNIFFPMQAQDNSDYSDYLPMIKKSKSWFFSTEYFLL